MPVNEGLRDGIEGKATCATLQVAPKRLLLSDNGSIAARRLLLDAVRANQTGGAVPRLDQPSHRCRAASVIVPQGQLADVPRDAPVPVVRSRIVG